MSQTCEFAGGGGAGWGLFSVPESSCTFCTGVSHCASQVAGEDSVQIRRVRGTLPQEAQVFTERNSSGSCLTKNTFLAKPHVSNIVSMCCMREAI